jgi:hypothetical protein
MMLSFHGNTFQQNSISAYFVLASSLEYNYIVLCKKIKVKCQVI